MLSNNTKKIIKDVDNVRKDIEINNLFEDYTEKLDRDFIQKYAEINITVFSTKITYISYFFAIVIVILAYIHDLYETLSPDVYQGYPNLNKIGLYLLIALLFLILYVFPKEFSKIDILKKIIIELEDRNKFPDQEPAESHVVSKSKKINDKIEELDR